MDDTPEKRPTRRGLLTAAGAVLATPALAGNPKNLPPNVPEWTRALGDGVAVRPYGQPSKHEAHVIRRDVQWLTASRESSVSFTPLHELDGIITPSGLCFERHHGGIAEIDPAGLPADRSRPRREGPDLHARRPEALPAREPHPFPRMRGEFRHGVARRAAQRLPVHPRHGALRRIHRRAAARAARRSGRASRTRSGCSPKARIQPR